MKKLIALTLAVLMTLATFATTGLGEAAQPYTFNVWTTFAELEEGDIGSSVNLYGAIKDILDQVAANNPGMEVNITYYSWNDMPTVLIPALNSGSGPDLFVPGDVSTNDLQSIMETGLYADLTSYAEQYGWTDRWQDWYYEEMIKKFNGRLYMAHMGMTALGVFYNKAVFREYGLEVPTTYDEFLNVCKTLYDNGVQPIRAAGADGWPYFHIESMFIAALDGNATMKDVLDNHGPFNTDGVLAAHSAFKDLIDLKYVDPNANAITKENSDNEFMAMQPTSAAMNLTGTWMMTKFDEVMGDDVGYFILPPAEGIETMPVAGIADSWAVSGSSEHIEQAAQFLDILLSVDNAYLIAQMGLITAYNGITDEQIDAMPNVNPLIKDATKAFAVSTDLAPNIDVYAPGSVNEVTTAEWQMMADGTHTPQEAVDNISAAFASAYAN